MNSINSQTLLIKFSIFIARLAAGHCMSLNSVFSLTRHEGTALYVSEFSIFIDKARRHRGMALYVSEFSMFIDKARRHSTVCL